MRVGITGGIGSGKSTVCQIFEQLQVPVFYADKETKILYDNNPLVRDFLIQEFGSNIYNGNILNRSALASIIFSDKQQLEKVNRFIHPLVFEQYEKWCGLHSGSAYTIKEAAIIFESGSHHHLHFVVAVVAPTELRIKRVMNRDQVGKVEVMARIKNQIPQEELERRCHFIINNDGTNSLITQVMNLHRELLNRALVNPTPAFLTD